MVTWNATNDRKLLLAVLKQLRGPIDYERISAEFGPDVSLNTLRIRMSTLKKGGERSSPGGRVKSGKIAKDFKATKAGVSKSGMEVNPEDEDTVVKKEEELQMSKKTMSNTPHKTNSSNDM